jgi:hydrogenase nickel incorporation protein HypA/HybF
MHELSLARALLRQVEELRQSHRAEGVRTVCVSVGEFSGVEADLLDTAFSQLTQGTPVDGAQLSIERVPLEARCTVCEHEFAVCGFRFVCPRCDARDVRTVRGEELMLETLTLVEAES